MEQLSFDDLDADPVPSKQCVWCGEIKPLGEFATNRSCKGGYNNRCLLCAEAVRQLIARRPAPQADFRKSKAARVRATAKIKAEVFDHYGWSCACCGSTRIPEIDHIDGNGRAHRIELFGTNNCGGPRFYQWLIKNGFPEGFQTLCARCNRHKGATDRCPLVHEEESAR